MPDQFVIYTDGSCLGNPGPGGYAFVVLQNDEVLYEGSGGDSYTTNNRMELTAAIEALRWPKGHSKITLYTDSNYVVKGITEWIHGWKRRGWKNSQNKSVENKDLWETLDQEAKPHQIQWVWVEAHAGNHYNERCDELAREVASRIQDSQT